MFDFISTEIRVRTILTREAGVVVNFFKAVKALTIVYCAWRGHAVFDCRIRRTTVCNVIDAVFSTGTRRAKITLSLLVVERIKILTLFDAPE